MVGLPSVIEVLFRFPARRRITDARPVLQELSRGEVVSGPGRKVADLERGGKHPLWSCNGHELFFKGNDKRIMVNTYTARADSFVPDKPETRRQQNHVTFLLNFADELQRKVPLGR